MFKDKELFLDYCQLFVTTKLTKDRIYNYLLSRLDSKEITKDTIKTDNEFVSIGDTSIKFHIQGSYFKHSNVKKNIKEIKQNIKKWFQASIFDDIKISRLDIAYNKYHSDMSNIYIRNTYDSEVKKISAMIDGQEVLQTVYIGKRNNKAPFYRCYDKRYDVKGAVSSITRFGTTEYCRSEWELKRDYLRERGINTIDDLDSNVLNTMFKWLSKHKSIAFHNPAYISQEFAQLPKKIKHAEATIEQLKKQIAGIYKNHFTYQQFIENNKKIEGAVYNGIS